MCSTCTCRARGHNYHVQQQFENHSRCEILSVATSMVALLCLVITLYGSTNRTAQVSVKNESRGHCGCAWLISEHTHVYTHVHSRTHTQIHTYTHRYTDTHMYTDRHTHAHVYIHMYTDTRSHAHTCMQTRVCRHTYAGTRMHTNTYRNRRIREHAKLFYMQRLLAVSVSIM